ITEEVRIHVGDRQAFRVLAVLDRDLPEQPAAEQVAFGDADFAHESIRDRIAARNRKFTGRLLFDVDVENDAIGSRAWVGRYLDAFEITEVLEASLGPIYQRAIVGIAFHDVEFAADHVIARARIPADVDPLDIGALRLGDGEEEIDSARLAVARRAWVHRREGKSLPRSFDGHVFDGLFDRLGVVDIARISTQFHPQQCRIERADRRLN